MLNATSDANRKTQGKEELRQMASVLNVL